MKKSLIFFLIASFLLFSCASAAQTAAQAEVVTIYATSAAEPWLTELYTCAKDPSLVLKVSAVSPDIYLRVGEPEMLISPAYQIDEEEILIVTHPESPIQNLSLEDAQALFAGQGDDLVQVWVYASDADIQILFDQFAMKGRSVTSFARVAVNPQQMSDVLNSESNSVGILPRRWNPSTRPIGPSGQGLGSLREVFSVGFAPVLAITKDEPSEMVNELIGCLQSD